MRQTDFIWVGFQPGHLDGPYGSVDEGSAVSATVVAATASASAMAAADSGERQRWGERVSRSFLAESRRTWIDSTCGRGGIFSDGSIREAALMP